MIPRSLSQKTVVDPLSRTVTGTVSQSDFYVGGFDEQRIVFSFQQHVGEDGMAFFDEMIS
jgi:hypothetical protein